MSRANKVLKMGLPKSVRMIIKQTLNDIVLRKLPKDY